MEWMQINHQVNGCHYIWGESVYEKESEQRDERKM